MDERVSDQAMRDKIRLVNERDHLLSLIGPAVDVIGIGSRTGPVRLYGAATFSYRLPDGTEYEVIVRDRG